MRTQIEHDFIDFTSGLYPPTEWLMQRKQAPDRVEIEEYASGCWRRTIKGVACTVRDDGWAYPNEGEFPVHPLWVGRDEVTPRPDPKYRGELIPLQPPNFVPAGCVTAGICGLMVIAVIAIVMGLRSLF